jgi:hypothetical protein
MALADGLLTSSALLARATPISGINGISGIYFLFSQDRVVYVGQSTSILHRVLAHMVAKRWRRTEITFDSWTYVECPPEALDRLERDYITALNPPLNNDALTRQNRGLRSPMFGKQAPPGQRNTRALIVAACSRPEGATSPELFAATGWKSASWSHQLKLITVATGIHHEIHKLNGRRRYFLIAQKPMQATG